MWGKGEEKKRGTTESGEREREREENQELFIFKKDLALDVVVVDEDALVRSSLGRRED